MNSNNNMCELTSDFYTSDYFNNVDNKFLLPLLNAKEIINLNLPENYQEKIILRLRNKIFNTPSFARPMKNKTKQRSKSEITLYQRVDYELKTPYVLYKEFTIIMI